MFNVTAHVIRADRGGSPYIEPATEVIREHAQGLLIRNQCFPLQIPRFTVQQEMVNFDLDSVHTKTPPYSQRIRGRSSTYAEMFIALEPHLFGVLVGICSLKNRFIPPFIPPCARFAGDPPPWR